MADAVAVGSEELRRCRWGNALLGWKGGVRAIHPKPFIPQLFSLKAFLPRDSELLSWMGWEGGGCAPAKGLPGSPWAAGLWAEVQAGHVPG